MAERGVEATERLVEVIVGRIRPTAAWRKPPLLPPLGSQGTARGPMRRLYDLADEMEKTRRSSRCRSSRGSPTRTSPTRGSASTWSRTTTRPSRSVSPTELARVAWAHRHEFVHTALPVKDAVAKALAAEGRPIVLADMADNTGGGAAGDGTEILRELLRVGAARRDGRLPLGCGGGAGVRQGRRRATRVTLDVGGKVDDRHGAPLRVTGTVRTLSDGRFVHRGPMLHGLPGRLGATAVLDVDDVKVILISLRWQTLDPEMIRFVGVEPLCEKIVVVKSTIHYRAAFEPIASEIVEVDAPGLSSSNLARFAFRRIRRPIFPLDPDLAYEPE